jgi:hypothetical protein
MASLPHQNDIPTDWILHKCRQRSVKVAFVRSTAIQDLE